VPEAVEMTACWEAPRPSHKPWKSLARFPHFHRTTTATLSQTNSERRHSSAIRPTSSPGSSFD
jgi:hypothetical protein